MMMVSEFDRKTSISPADSRFCSRLTSRGRSPFKKLTVPKFGRFLMSVVFPACRGP